MKPWINPMYAWVQKILACLVSCIFLTIVLYNNIILLKVTFHLKHNSLLIVNPPPVIPLQQLINPQPPVTPSPIPASATTYLHVPNNPLQNTVNSPQAHLVLCQQLNERHLNCNLNPSSRRFPHSLNVSQTTNNAAVFNNFQLSLIPSTANPAISHQILQSTPPQNVNSNHAATSFIPGNLFGKTTNICAQVAHCIPHLRRQQPKMQV